MNEEPSLEPKWKWSWSPLVGVMYGRIPVGLIIAIPVLIAVFAR